MKHKFIDVYRSEFSVQKMCQIFKVSKGGYYKWKQQPESKREKENKKMIEKIKIIHKENDETYGSPRITERLKQEGIAINEKRVARLMKINDICAKTKRKFKKTTNSQHNYPIAPNLLQQNFTAISPNSIWLSDITYIRTNEGWLYLAAILDVYSRKIVGWAMDKRQTKKLVCDALLQAVSRQNISKGILLHSDRGSQYASYTYQNLCKEYGFIQSMSSTGNCYDNAMMESFFHTLKTERIYWEKYYTREQAKRSIFEYIEVKYNRKRLHSAIQYKTPIEFENLYKVA